MLNLARRVRPHDQKISGGNISVAELDIPRALASYSPLLSDLSAHLLPDQDMVNWIQNEIAIAGPMGPPFAPYLDPKLSDTPWMPFDADRRASLSRWATFSKHALRALLPTGSEHPGFFVIPHALRFLS